MKYITIKEAAMRLGLPTQRMYGLDTILKPVFQTRGFKMKTRLYDPEYLEQMRPEIVKLGIKDNVTYEDGEKRKYRKRYLTPKENWEGALLYMYNSLCHGAKLREYTNTLSVANFERIIRRPCYFCGTEPEPRKLGRYEVLANGIDRFDNNKGYIGGNCVPCCKLCNRMKSDKTFEEFLSHVKKICKHNVEVKP